MNNFMSFDDALEQIKAQGEQERRTIEIAEAIANNEAADAIEKLLAENEQLKKKFDAAVRDIFTTAYREGKMPCAVCAHADEPLVNGISPCSGCCESNSKFLWRGED